MSLEKKRWRDSQGCCRHATDYGSDNVQRILFGSPSNTLAYGLGHAIGIDLFSQEAYVPAPLSRSITRRMSGGPHMTLRSTSHW